MIGRITKQISNQYTVKTKSQEYICTARGKFRNLNISPVVGDIVEFDEANLRINEIKPRINILSRPTVANIDYALIVTSLKKPDLSYTLLDKLITLVIANNIKPIIVLTKIDLMPKSEFKEYIPAFKYYEALDIPVIFNTKLKKLKKLLKGKTVVLAGQTGAGKSSLLNKLDKNLNIETKPISEALNRGVHTTRHTEIYEIDNIYFVDTPGFSALDLSNLSPEEIKNTFREFNKYTCEYQDCTHNNELGCGVKEALKKGEILPSRYINYIRFLKEINENISKLHK